MEPPTQQSPCVRGAICRYEINESCLSASCPSAGQQWATTYGECGFQTANGDWMQGYRSLEFAETVGMCGLSNRSYIPSEHRLYEYTCELVERAIDDCTVHEALECEHETGLLSLSLSFSLEWSESAGAWFGQAEAGIFSEELAIDCTSSYNLRAN